MKNPFSLLVITILLVACSGAPSVQTIQTAIAETQKAQPSLTATPIPQASPTFIPTSTLTVTPSASPTTTAAATPTVTASRTPAMTVTASASSTHTPTESPTPLAVAACIPQNGTEQEGYVTRVADGDTIDVRLEDGKTYSVRYIGVNSPEAGFPFATEASNANSALVWDKQVKLIKDVSEVDQYGRLLRYVIADNIFVNLEMVRKGYAEEETFPPDVACADAFTAGANEAHAEQVGMWVATETPEASAALVIIVTVNKKTEYVDIQNVGKSDVDLEGWKLVSERGNQGCPLSGIIKVSATLRIWSMTAQGDGFSCGYTSPIWNNSQPDPAVLYNAQGVEVSRK